MPTLDLHPVRTPSKDDIHTVVRALDGERLLCRARGCTFATVDMGQAIRHVSRTQFDATGLPPLPWPGEEPDQQPGGVG